MIWTRCITFEYGQDFTGDGLDNVKVTLSLTPESNSGTEDLLGVAFDIRDDNVAGLTIDSISRATGYGTLSTYVPTYVIGANQVADGGPLDPGFSTSGGNLDENGESYDVGIKFSEQGRGEDIVQSASFVLNLPGSDIDAKALLDYTDWWVRLQSTDGGEESAKMALFDLILPPPVEPPPLENGVANTPGFWKQPQHFQYWSGYEPGNSFSVTFGIEKFDLDPSKRAPGDQDLLIDALSANGGGQYALARAATAALLNAASDEAGSGINYVIDEAALAISVLEVGADLAAVMETLDLIDTSLYGAIGYGVIGVDEVKAAVKDVFTDGGVFSAADINRVAVAFDAMNNMLSLEVEDF